MSWQVIAALVLVIVLLVGGGGYLDHRLSYDAGYASNVANCKTELDANKASYQTAQTDAVAKAGKAQQAADAAQLADVRSQLAQAQQQSLKAQQAADAAKATAATLNSNLVRLKNESKDVDTWSNACLPVDLLVSLHPETSGKAPAGACR